MASPSQILKKTKATDTKDEKKDAPVNRRNALIDFIAKNKKK